MRTRTELVQALARRWPRLCEAIVGRSIQGRLPARIHQHWLGRAAAAVLFADGARVYGSPFLFRVPLALLPTYRAYEPLAVEAFRSRLRRDQVVIDVGAHAGYYTVAAGRAVGPGGVVHAFEPCPLTLDLLARNVAANRLHNVRIHPCAAGATPGRRVLHVTASSMTNAFVESPYEATSGTVVVDERPVDAVVAGSAQLVKVDVEGAELDALAGMRGLLGRSDQAELFVEWSPPNQRAAGRDPHELLDRLRDEGFPSLTLLDDLRGRRLSVDQALAEERAGTLPPLWYCTLWARRQGATT